MQRWYEWSTNGTNRVTTCLENLEMSGKYTYVRKMSLSGVSVKVGKLSGKKILSWKIVQTRWPLVWKAWKCRGIIHISGTGSSIPLGHTTQVPLHTSSNA